jgi:hypothetical protein
MVNYKLQETYKDWQHHSPSEKIRNYKKHQKIYSVVLCVIDLTEQKQTK